MYWNSILWFISWMVLIYISYLLVAYTMRKYESVLEKPVKKAHPEKEESTKAASAHEINEAAFFMQPCNRAIVQYIDNYLNKKLL